MTTTCTFCARETETHCPGCKRRACDEHILLIWDGTPPFGLNIKRSFLCGDCSSEKAP